MRPIELLSPARNLECGIEAIRHGADAVYIGAVRFGARAAAGNRVEDIARLVEYAHPFGVRIYVTLNTLLYDDELPAAQALINELSAIHVDALITQDPRIVPAAVDGAHGAHVTDGADSPLIFSAIPLHASTQMDNRTISDVLARQAAGYQQTVLARELSLDDIRTIHAAVPEMALEAFVHGALCVSYSGRCYASEYCFGRSANRGECAQFCRLPFDLVDADGRLVTAPDASLQRQRHLLSLKDMNRSTALEAMMDAGVTSFKIEGRLKDVSYVKNVTAYYRRELDAILSRRPADYCRASLGTSSFTFTPDVQKSFNRRFTDYFLHGRTRDMACPATPKAVGEAVGTVKALFRDALSVAGVTAFHNGDGLCFFDADDRLCGFRVNRVDPLGHLYPADPAVLRVMHKGMSLYRNFDAQLERLLSRPSAERHLPVRWQMDETPDGFRLTLTSKDSPSLSFKEGASLSSVGNPMSSPPVSSISIVYPHERARTPQADNIRRQLLRLGDTPYTCAEEDIDIRFTDNWFIPASVVGEWRREVVGAMEAPPALPERGQNVSAKRVPHRCADKSGTLTAPSITGRAVDVSAGASPLMTCRYCLRHELGYCTLDGRPLPFCPPLRLRLADGRTFPLRFDCARCEMAVLRES